MITIYLNLLTKLSVLLVSLPLLAEDTPAGKSPSFIEVLILPLGLLVIVYFFIIRPQARKAREHSALLQNLKVGEEVVTSGGIIGKIKAIADSFVTLEVGTNVCLKVVINNISGYTKKTGN